ncbi:CcmD family protein [Desulfovibrio sp. OttesenSCG-928-G15]|nr:CcmD family protein [Desulfovibrio sp. OttesenSCG-928-G15]
MNSYEWIMYAGIAVWSGIGLYVCYLGRKQAKLAKRIERMAQMLETQ